MNPIKLFALTHDQIICIDPNPIQSKSNPNGQDKLYIQSNLKVNANTIRICTDRIESIRIQFDAQPCNITKISAAYIINPKNET